ncbi:MAG: hypothetical protein WDO18_17280 [Acidobacteriota bacterium]
MLTAWQWSPQPEAGTLVREQVGAICGRSDFATHLAARLLRDAGTRIVDLVELLVLPEPEVARAMACGWKATGPGIYANHAGQFPKVAVGDEPGLFIKVESAAEFLKAHGLERTIESGRARIDRGFGVIEQRCSDASAPEILEVFQNRDREGFEDVERIVEEAVAAIGSTSAALLFSQAEREFWQSRNRAAQVQKRRQDALGIGWANHDHHTYRSSRGNFARMITLFERLGFHCRERFYAGLAAGWGAQVLENPAAGIVLFCDVDLTPDELQGDFAHEGLATRSQLNTIGLWCELHGDSLLQAGMHHLECTFAFDALREQLAAEHIASMKPFTEFSYLRQAFTEGERWRVAPERLTRLVKNGSITTEQARRFAEEGAVGSHLENLERNDGFKGFNQTGVNEIIAATDPRRAMAQG